MNLPAGFQYSTRLPADPVQRYVTRPLARIREIGDSGPYQPRAFTVPEDFAKTIPAGEQYTQQVRVFSYSYLAGINFSGLGVSSSSFLVDIVCDWNNQRIYSNPVLGNLLDAPAPGATQGALPLVLLPEPKLCLGNLNVTITNLDTAAARQCQLLLCMLEPWPGKYGFRGSR